MIARKSQNTSRTENHPPVDGARQALFAPPSHLNLPGIAFGFTAVLVMVFIALSVIVRSQYLTNESSVALFRKKLESLSTMARLETLAAESSADFRGFLLTHDRKFLERSQNATLEFNDNVLAFENSSLSPKLGEHFAEIKSLSKQITLMRAQTAAQSESRQRPAEAIEAYTQDLFPLTEKLAASINLLRKNSILVLQENLEETYKVSRSTFFLLLGFATLCLVVAIILAIWYTQRTAANLKQMKQAMDKFAMAIKVSDDLVWELDLQTGEVRISEGVFSRFQYGSFRDSDALSKKIHPEDRERVLTGFQQALDKDNRDLWTDFYRLERIDGTFSDVAARALIARDEKRKPFLVLGAVMDISELKQAIRARDEMAAVISHELKNPVASIEMAADLLERELASSDISPTARNALARLKPISHRMSRLLRDQLDINRIESQTIAVDPGVYDAVKILDDVMFYFRPQAEAKNITLTSLAPPGLPKLLCDRDRMIQILSNLVGNALKFTPDFGRVTIRAINKVSFIEFEVADSGSGIAPENLERVFDRFWRASHKRKDSSGLGLAIAKGLVLAQGGKIWVESELNRGSSFHFTIPTATEYTSETVAPTLKAPLVSNPPKPRQLRDRVLVGIRVLLVDDSEDSLFLTKTLLEIAGAEVIEADSAQAALFVLKTFTPDILFTDIEMPEKSGIDLLREVRESPEAKDQPELQRILAIAMTAHESPSELARVRAAGFDYVLQKPISYDLVLETMTSLLEKRRSTDKTTAAVQAT